MKVKTCPFFEHSVDGKHKCNNEKNVTQRCGYSLEEIGACPVAGPITEKEIISSGEVERMKAVDVDPKRKDALEDLKDHEQIFGVKGRAILPFRLIDQAKKEFPQLDFPVKSKGAKEANMEAVKQANHLVMFIDDEFFTPGKSLGTKIEATNNLRKISEVYQFKDGKFIPSTVPSITEKLPTWEEYVSTIE